MWKSNILLVFPFNKNWNDKAIYLKEVKNHYFNINCRYQFLKGFYSYWKWWGCKQYIYVDLGRLWIHSEESRILRRIYVDFVYIPGYTLCKCFFGSCKFLLLLWFYSVLWSFLINLPVCSLIFDQFSHQYTLIWTSTFIFYEQLMILYFCKWPVFIRNCNFIPICLFGAVCLFILTKFLASTFIWSSTFIRNLRV